MDTLYQVRYIHFLKEGNIDQHCAYIMFREREREHTLHKGVNVGHYTSPVFLLYPCLLIQA